MNYPFKIIPLLARILNPVKSSERGFPKQRWKSIFFFLSFRFLLFFHFPRKVDLIINQNICSFTCHPRTEFKESSRLAWTKATVALASHSRFATVGRHSNYSMNLTLLLLHFCQNLMKLSCKTLMISFVRSSHYLPSMTQLIVCCQITASAVNCLVISSQALMSTKVLIKLN